MGLSAQLMGPCLVVRPVEVPSAGELEVVDEPFGDVTSDVRESVSPGFKSGGIFGRRP